MNLFEIPDGIAKEMHICVRMFLEGPDEGITDHVIQGDIVLITFCLQVFNLVPQRKYLPGIGTQVVRELGRILQGGMHGL